MRVMHVYTFFHMITRKLVSIDMSVRSIVTAAAFSNSLPDYICMCVYWLRGLFMVRYIHSYIHSHTYGGHIHSHTYDPSVENIKYNFIFQAEHSSYGYILSSRATSLQATTSDPNAMPFHRPSFAFTPLRTASAFKGHFGF